MLLSPENNGPPTRVSPANEVSQRPRKRLKGGGGGKANKKKRERPKT